MKIASRKRTVTFERMITLLNQGLNQYIEELGSKSFRNPAFIFTEKKSA